VTNPAPIANRFIVKFDGKVIGTFMELSGLSVEIETEDVKEGGQNDYVHKLPGRMKWPNLVLKRGITDPDNLFQWFLKAADDDSPAEPVHGSVQFLDESGKPVRTWNFEGGIPVKWSGPKLAVSSTEIATEELEIAHHGFRPEKGSKPA